MRGNGYDSFTVILLSMRYATQKRRSTSFSGAKRTRAAHSALECSMTPALILRVLSNPWSSCDFETARYSEKLNGKVPVMRSMRRDVALMCPSCPDQKCSCFQSSARIVGLLLWSAAFYVFKTDRNFSVTIPWGQG